MPEKFDFARAAERAFLWLQELGYAVSERKPSLLRFRGPSTLVNIYHGRSSGEIGVEACCVGGEDGEAFSMSELIRLEDPNAADSHRNPIAVSEDEVTRAIAAQSERLQKYGGRVVRGEDGVWDALRAQRKEWGWKFAAQVLAARVRPMAAEAFRERDYGRVVELLSKIEDQLTPAEHQKLDYARRHASK